MNPVFAFAPVGGVHFSVNQSEITQGLAAKKLGVTREHLNRVLRGHRQSRSLVRRYDELIKG